MLKNTTCVAVLLWKPGLACPANPPKGGQTTHHANTKKTADYKHSRTGGARQTWHTTIDASPLAALGRTRSFASATMGETLTDCCSRKPEGICSGRGRRPYFLAGWLPHLQEQAAALPCFVVQQSSILSHKVAPMVHLVIIL